MSHIVKTSKLINQLVFLLCNLKFFQARNKIIFEDSYGFALKSMKMAMNILKFAIYAAKKYTYINLVNIFQTVQCVVKAALCFEDQT